MWTIAGDRCSAKKMSRTVVSQLIEIALCLNAVVIGECFFIACMVGTLCSVGGGVIVDEYHGPSESDNEYPEPSRGTVSIPVA